MFIKLFLIKTVIILDLIFFIAFLPNYFDPIKVPVKLYLEIFKIISKVD